MSRANLIAICEAKVSGGDLPDTLCTTRITAPADGAACTSCGAPIPASTSEVEFYWFAGERLRSARVHPHCYYAWIEVVRRPSVAQVH